MNYEKRYVILAVDDAPTSLQLVEKALSDLFHIVPVTSGKDALAFLSSKSADLLLLDVMMPEMDGFSVFNEIKKRRSREVPVIFLTAAEDSESEIKALEMGAVDFIRKPFSQKALKQRVYSHLTRSLDFKNTKNLLEKHKIEFESIDMDAPNKLVSLERIYNELRSEYQAVSERAGKMSSIIKGLLERDNNLDISIEKDKKIIELSRRIEKNDQEIDTFDSRYQRLKSIIENQKEMLEESEKKYKKYIRRVNHRLEIYINTISSKKNITSDDAKELLSLAREEIRKQNALISTNENLDHISL